ncbi:MAG: hypothetical protein ACYTHJ_07165 [Planctomycetota bacterium]
MNQRATTTWIMTTLLALSATSVQAGIIRDVRWGLEYAGFETSAWRDFIGNGINVEAVTVFPDIPIDIGIAEYSISGPMSMELYAGGRALDVVKLRFQTALQNNEPSVPITYTASYDVGGQQADITGSLLIDGEFTLNSFLFYSIELEYSSRQTVVRDGNIVDDELETDFDVGPLNIRGNIIADVLAAITSPLLGNDPETNPFIELSGRNQFKELLQSAKNPAVLDLATGALPGDYGFLAPAEADLEAAAASRNIGSVGVVPEPAVLALMLVALPIALRRTRD